jgi:hypothetical protein
MQNARLYRACIIFENVAVVVSRLCILLARLFVCLLISREAALETLLSVQGAKKDHLVFLLKNTVKNCCQPPVPPPNDNPH